MTWRRSAQSSRNSSATTSLTYPIRKSLLAALSGIGVSVACVSSWVGPASGAVQRGNVAVGTLLMASRTNVGNVVLSALVPKLVSPPMTA